MTLHKTFDFLNSLKENNNREWFGLNKSVFLEAQEEVRSFTSVLENLMTSHDEIDVSSTKVFRIYKNVRFSKDKTPYKTSWSGSFKRASQSRRGGYYFQIQPGNSFVMGGFFGPNPQDLLHMRKQLSQDPTPLRNVLQSKKFQNVFGELEGDQVKSAPKGFSKEDENIDLLRYKQFMVRYSFSDKEALSTDFPNTMSNAFKEMRPFFDAMSELLTTDLNGLSLVD